MSHHEIHFTNLIDWLDNRLDTEARERVEAHVASCPACQRDLAWLQRVIQAARSDDTVEPPAEAVAQVKALYRAQKATLRAQQRAPRLAFAFALTLVLLISMAWYLTQVPTLFAREATLTTVLGSAQVRRADSQTWQEMAAGETVREGDGVRVLDGTAVLALFEGSLLEMQAGSELALSRLRSGLFGATYQIVLGQTAGVVDYNVAPLRSALCRFEAYAPTVRVAVHGTRFVIAVQSQEQTQVTVLQGRVEVTSAVTKTVLVEREAAVVPANAPLVYLPTLTPLPTPEPAATPTPSPAAPTLPSPTATPTHMPALPPQQGRHPTAVPPSSTPQPMPSQTPSPTPSVSITPTLTLEANRVPFRGVIESLPARLLGAWTISGQTVWVTPRTQITGTPEVGRHVRGIALATAGQALVALRIEIEEPYPTATPSPGLGTYPTATPQPMRTTVPGPRPSPIITVPPMRTPIATLLPRRTPHRTPIPSSTPSPQPSASPEATATPPATDWADASPTPEPTIVRHKR